MKFDRQSSAVLIAASFFAILCLEGCKSDGSYKVQVKGSGGSSFGAGASGPEAALAPAERIGDSAGDDAGGGGGGGGVGGGGGSSVVGGSGGGSSSGGGPHEPRGQPQQPETVTTEKDGDSGEERTADTNAHHVPEETHGVETEEDAPGTKPNQPDADQTEEDAPGTKPNQPDADKKAQEDADKKAAKKAQEDAAKEAAAKENCDQYDEESYKCKTCKLSFRVLRILFFYRFKNNFIIPIHAKPCMMGKW